MYIYNTILCQLLYSVPDVPPESGGILGGMNGIISHLWIDKGNQYDIYYPDVKRFNQIILDWQNSGIEFCGIFHTHSLYNKTLSVADKNYIEKIMTSMPPQITMLYFPLVFPKNSVVPYRADFRRQCVTIVQETLEILHLGGNHNEG